MTGPVDRSARADILIVDDAPANLQLLANTLKERGFAVRPVPSGDLALQAAKAKPPDLILLDITMPGMSGFEVCTRLKADADLADVPVLFLSSLAETMDKVKALGLGGADYITKPFQLEEVEARVRTHLELRRQKRELQENYRRLADLEALRDGLVHMIAHDMRDPLSSLQGFLKLLRPLAAAGPNASANRYLDLALASTHELIEMVSTMLDLSKLEAGQMKLQLAPCDLAALARAAVQRAEGQRGDRTVSVAAPDEAPLVTCDAELIARVLQNLLANARKFTPGDGEIRVRVEPETGGETVRMSVQDNGPGIAPEYRERIFEKFGQVGVRQKHSTGLGLAFCRLAVGAHGGRIGVESEVGKGSTFWLTLPRQGPAAAQGAGP